VYGLVIYQDASGDGAQAAIGSSTSSYFGTSGTNSQNQLAVRVGIRHKF
jgi:preprotein translocase subunit SecG